MESKVKKLKLLISDVDGVLTDGSIHISESGYETKIFNVRDGAGIKYLQRSGIEFAIITGRASKATLIRARELGIKILHQGIFNKEIIFDKILAEHKLIEEEVGFVGDDLLDLPVMKRVGVSFTVQDAVAEVKNIADYITKANGGKGAIREIAELILKTQGKWRNILKRYE